MDNNSNAIIKYKVFYSCQLKFSYLCCYLPELLSTANGNKRQLHYCKINKHDCQYVLVDIHCQHY